MSQNQKFFYFNQVTSLDLICENPNTEVRPVKFKSIDGEEKGIIICVLATN